MIGKRNRREWGTNQPTNTPDSYRTTGTNIWKTTIPIPNSAPKELGRTYIRPIPNFTPRYYAQQIPKSMPKETTIPKEMLIPNKIPGTDEGEKLIRRPTGDRQGGQGTRTITITRPRGSP